MNGVSFFGKPSNRLTVAGPKTYHRRLPARSRRTHTTTVILREVAGPIKNIDTTVAEIKGEDQWE